MKQKTDIVRKELKQNSDVDENYPRIIFVDSMLNINTCNIKYTIIFSEGEKKSSCNFLCVAKTMGKIIQ